MGKFLETIAIDSTKLITGGDSDPSGSPTAHDDRAAISHRPLPLPLYSPIASPVMLLLDYQNVLIQSLLTERFSGYCFPSAASLRTQCPPHLYTQPPRLPANCCPQCSPSLD